MVKKNQIHSSHTKCEVFGSFFEQSTEGVLIVNSAKLIRFENPGAGKALGYRASELNGKNIYDIVSLEEHGKLNDLLDKFLTSGARFSAFKTELSLIKKDGSIIHTEVSIGNHIHSTEGPLLIFVFTDISEKKRYEEELQRSRELFYDTFRQNPAPSAISRLSDGRYVDVNDSFLSALEFEREDIIGKTSTELGLFRHCKPEEREKLVALLGQNQSVLNYEITLSTKADKPVHVLFSAKIIQLEKEDHILSSMIDITLSKKAQETLEDLNEILEQRIKERTLELTKALEREKDINEKKSRFVTMASHEFRTPLGTVLTSAAILEKYTNATENERLNRHFNRIKSSVSNLTEILDEFIVLEKIEKGKDEPQNSNFSLPLTVKDGIAEINERLKSGQNISHTHSGNELIFQDRNKVYNTILNLISNAVKYSRDDGKIEINSEVADGKVKITVRDHGIGIPEKDQENLFTLFFRAKNAAVIQGTGLGLCIVKNYMELIGGTIKFTSKENEGSVFEVCFPSNSEK